MNSIHEVLAGTSVNPGLVGSTACTQFGDNYQAIGIRMERLLNDLICDMRAVVVAGIDVVHAGFHRRAQDSDGLVRVAWRSEYLRSRQLHRAITHAVYGQRRAWKRKASAEIDLLGHLR